MIIIYSMNMAEFTLPIQMIKTYLVRRQEEIPVLRKSLADGSHEEFNKIGHKLLGNARTYGFEVLEPLAAKMNSLKSEELASVGPALVDEYEKWVNKANSEMPG